MVSTRGRCRSVSTVAGFLMSHCHMSFSDALCLLREKRPQMRINDGSIGCQFSMSSLFETTALFL